MSTKPMEYVGVFGGIITTSGGIPQLYKIYRTRSAKDLSWGMLCMWATGLSMTLTYGISTNQFPVYVPAICSLTMTTAMLLSKWWFSRDPEEKYSALTRVP